MRRNSILLLTAAFAAGIAITTAQTTSPKSQTTAKKKTTTKTAAKKKATTKKRVLRPPPVSAKVRASASDAVSRWLDVPSTLENARALIPFLELLYRSEKDPESPPLHILHYGDSHTAADDWSGTMRYLFQNKFGDGGAGFSHAGRPWTSYRRQDVKSFSSLKWYTHGLAGRDGDGMYGLAGIGISATKANEHVILDAECQSAELFYLQQPGGGNFEVILDGGEAQKIETDGDAAPGYVKIPMEAGQHHFEVRTLDARPIRLFGWATDNKHGLTWETMGINGAQASIQLKWDERLLADHIARRNPALIVLAYGTNEAGNKDLTVAGYRDMFIKVLQQLRRDAPTASLLVIGPPDRWIRGRAGWVAMDNVDIIVEAQRQASIAAGAAFFDLRDRMGGKGSMRQWVYAGMAQYDHVHFTGQGYRMLGAALYKEIAGQFATYVKVRDEPAGKPGENSSAHE